MITGREGATFFSDRRSTTDGHLIGFYPQQLLSGLVFFLRNSLQSWNDPRAPGRIRILRGIRGENEQIFPWRYGMKIFIRCSPDHLRLFRIVVKRVNRGSPLQCQVLRSLDGQFIFPLRDRKAHISSKKKNVYRSTDLQMRSCPRLNFRCQ